MYKWKLIWPVLFSILLPLTVAFFVYPAHLPPGFGVFPPQYTADNPPGFSLPIFIALSAFCVWFAYFLISPQNFGFKGGEPVPRPSKKAPYPWWFWFGTVIMLFFWWLMWSHSTAFGELVYWSFSPLWWGFILFLDGIVYRRNNGISLISCKPMIMLFAYVVSIFGWAYFEYYDYFVLGNWYYPYADQAPWSENVRTIEFLITYGTITPVLLEVYCLLKTFPSMTSRYQNGPKMKITANQMLIAGTLLTGLMVIFPYPFFWVVWVGPFAILSGCLIKERIPNTFISIAEKGDWTGGVLMGIASLIVGFFWEMWNHGSMMFSDTPTNPNYWLYNIPYVNEIHIFSEMPLLGYSGYIPFGVLVCQTFIWAGKLCGVDYSYDLTPIYEDDQSEKIKVSKAQET